MHWLDRMKDTKVSYSGTLASLTKIFTDSERTLQTVHSEGVIAHNKHFDIQLFKVHEVQNAGIIDFTFIPGEQNTADQLMKALVDTKHQQFMRQLGMGDMGSHSEVDLFLLSSYRT
ncbi:hypothetical protein L873DRAFT_1930066 [Choiromyces venosus 120613-1]|uniref:Uncharacterized protein n=1 Tax=Choiromyces venosus 120613-1 TaxID=1336337 RepID=A0A3N4JC17_9PEZI|nr:hypothetical protein L873DRAFT_1930066 [Choiromyces venosus 120613-1]